MLRLSVELSADEEALATLSSNSLLPLRDPSKMRWAGMAERTVAVLLDDEESRSKMFWPWQLAAF